MFISQANHAKRHGITLNSLLFIYTLIGILLLLSASEGNWRMVIKQCVTRLTRRLRFIDGTAYEL